MRTKCTYRAMSVDYDQSGALDARGSRMIDHRWDAHAVLCRVGHLIGDDPELQFDLAMDLGVQRGKRIRNKQRVFDLLS